MTSNSYKILKGCSDIQPGILYWESSLIFLLIVTCKYLARKFLRNETRTRYYWKLKNLICSTNNFKNSKCGSRDYWKYGLDRTENRFFERSAFTYSQSLLSLSGCGTADFRSPHAYNNYGINFVKDLLKVITSVICIWRSRIYTPKKTSDVHWTGRQ